MSAAGAGIRYQPDEKPAPALVFGMGLQIVILSLAGVILVPTIVMRVGGAGESYLHWAVFATVAICGAATVLHAFRVLAGRHRPSGRNGACGSLHRCQRCRR